MIKKFSFLIGILLFSLHFGQKKEQLQQQNAELKKQIAKINSELAKTRNESKLSVSYLTSVNQKLALREKVYNNTQKEKRFSFSLADLLFCSTDFFNSWAAFVISAAFLS